jgi:tetratricopeptide (TPR) repeat protein
MPLSESLEALRRFGEQERLLREAMKQQPDRLELGWSMGYCQFGQGSLEGIKAFARRKVPVEQQSVFNYLQSDLAFLCGDWREFFRLREIQRYYDGNTDDPRWGQDAELAAGYAASGDMETAQARARDALVQLDAEKAKQPDNAKVWANLSTVHAILGHRKEVLECVARASALLPESRDALVAPGNSIICAEAYASVGEKDRAILELRRLLTVPCGAVVPFARVHFSSLHGDPRFEALLADPANSAPLTGL